MIRLIYFLAVSVSIASLALTLYGFWLRSTLHSADDECDMTFSAFNFVQIALPPMITRMQQQHQGLHHQQEVKSSIPKISDTSGSDENSLYKLYKFTDRRDQRYAHLFHQQSNSSSSPPQWCQTYTSRFPNSKVGFPVLYVPGHFGEYHQARSLGAHGIQLSAGSSVLVRKKLLNGTMRSSTTTRSTISDNSKGNDGDNDLLLDDFVYDVYAVDFGGEGSAFHASKLVSQSEFIAKSIRFIVDQCGNNYDDGGDDKMEIIIVAHSMGGLAARRAAVLLQKQEQDLVDTAQSKTKVTVKNIITLATPHVAAPMNLDTSLWKFYKLLETEEKKYQGTTATKNLEKENPSIDNDSQKKLTQNSFESKVISISGGIRDEMIPPEWCNAEEIDDSSSVVSGTCSSNTSHKMEGEDNSCKALPSGFKTSFLASDIMPPKDSNQTGKTVSKQPPGYGMDHRAIVWCHNILSVVRELIHMMVVTTSNLNDLEKREQIQNFLTSKMGNISGTCIDTTGIVDKDVCRQQGYLNRVDNQRERLEENVGFLGMMAIESAMLYNVQLLTLFYFLNGIIIVSFGKVNNFLTKSVIKDSERNRSEMAAKLFLSVPILSFAIGYYLFRQGPIFYPERKVVQIVLSFAAMNIYYAILYGLIPVVSFLLRTIGIPKCNKNTLNTQKRDGNESNLKLRYLILLVRNNFQYFVMSLIYTVLMKVLSGIDMLNMNDLVINQIAIKSHLFLLILWMIMIDIIWLGCRPVTETDKMAITNCNHGKKVAVWLFPLIPLISMGKVIYAMSLLTLNGQNQAMPFLELESEDWETSYGGYYCSFLFEVLWKHDLERHFWLLLIPAIVVRASFMRKSYVCNLN